MLPDQIPPKFCPNPFVYLMTSNDQQVKFCCLLPQGVRDDDGSLIKAETDNIDRAWCSRDLQNTRQNMLEGKGWSDCRVCYDIEGAGSRSLRQDVLDRWFDPKRQSFLRSAIDQHRLGNNPQGPISIEFRSGNICNLRCRMCNPDDSNLISKEYDRLNLQFPQWSKLYIQRSTQIGTDSADEIISHLDTLQELRLSGGEPLYNPRTFTVLQAAVESGHASHIDLFINTNFTKIDTDFIDLLSCFRSIELFASIDGIGSVNDYIRTGSDWNSLERNFNLFFKQDHKIRLFINVTTQNLNVMSLGDIIKWSLSRSIWPIISVLSYPPYLSVSNMPTSLKQAARAHIENILSSRALQEFQHANHVKSRLTSVLNAMEIKTDRREIRKFLEFTKILDNSRGQFIDDCIPGLLDFYTEPF